MLRSAIFAAFVAVVTAQATNYSTSGPLTINITQVPFSLRQTWCTAQQAQCPLICGSVAYPNTCNATTLDWTCTCDNGNKPNISAYDQTIPSFVCYEWYNNCVAGSDMNLTAQQECQDVRATCGNKTISAAASTSVESVLATATTPTSSPTGSASQTSTGASSATTSPHSGAVAMEVAKSYGSGILFTGLLAVFGLAL